MLMCNLSLTSGIIKLIIPHVLFVWASLVAQRLKRLPGMQETQVRSLSREDPLEKEMATHSSTLAWRIPLGRSLVGYSRWGRKESDTTERPHSLTPWWLNGKESTCQCGRHGFDLWVRKIPWRRKWQPTPVFLPGKSHRERHLVGYSSWGRKESNTTKLQQRYHL